MIPVCARTLATGLMGLASFVGRPAVAEDMSFRLASIGDPGKCGAGCPEIIAAEGEIVDDTPEQFVAFLRAHQTDRRVRSVVFVNSPGGRVGSSMRLGRAFRQLGVATVVARVSADDALTSARCYSACVYAFMGGKKRVVPPQSALGIHRMFSYEPGGRDPSGDMVSPRRKPGDSQMVGLLSDYTARMGVSREAIAKAEETPSESIHIVTPTEIARWHLGSSRL